MPSPPLPSCPTAETLQLRPNRALNLKPRLGLGVKAKMG
jgi:hypothetical protein